jgi:putative glycosyltransferase (TIGR04372 family)
MRRAEQARWGVTDVPVTVMHETWVQAIGHIAHLDTYVKSMRLGWIPEQRSVLAFNASRPPTGWPLLKHWAKHIEVVSSTRDLADALDERIFSKTDDLERDDRDRRRAALMSFFWSGADGEGQARWYGPLGSAVQHAWRAAGHGPLLSVSDAEQDHFRTLMHQLFGLPKDAWFALLHVRESGYKTQWEAVHAYTRNANIEAYDEAVQHIVDRGGWVIRGGDPSMRPIRPRPNVIDYATSPYRTPDLDILLCANCRFFLGTNSGFSLVPPLFGRPCALTNWSPLATPNWYPEDIVVPKLVRRRATGELLSFDEMLRTSAGRSQFQRDFQGEFEQLDNAPEDLTAAVAEMLDELDGTLVATPDELARRAKYDAIAQAADVYAGSRMGLRFLTKYAQLL